MPLRLRRRLLRWTPDRLLCPLQALQRLPRAPARTSSYCGPDPVSLARIMVAMMAAGSPARKVARPAPMTAPPQPLAFTPIIAPIEATATRVPPQMATPPALLMAMPEAPAVAD